MTSALKALGITVTYVVAVAAVAGAALLTPSGDATPWMALLVAMAIVHLGFGLFVGRWSAALLPILAAAVAFVVDVNGSSIVGILVGVPCVMLVIAGTSLRIGWDGGAKRAPRVSRRERRELQRERRRLRDEARAVELDHGGFSYEDPSTWPETPYPA